MTASEWWDNLYEEQGDKILKSLGVNPHEADRMFEGDANGYQYLKPHVKILLTDYWRKNVRGKN